MCNLYSITRSQEAMRRLLAVASDLTGNLPPLPDVFPDQMAPIVRVADGERQLELMRWGMPGPPQFGGAPPGQLKPGTRSAGRIEEISPASLPLPTFTQHHRSPR